MHIAQQEQQQGKIGIRIYFGSHDNLVVCLVKPLNEQQRASFSSMHSTLYIKVKKRDMILNGNTLTPHINREVGLRKVQGRTSSVQQKVMAFQT